MRRFLAAVGVLGLLWLSASALAAPRLSLINTARQVMPFAIYPNSLCLDATNQDACLERISANALAMRRGTAVQEFRVYGSGTAFLAMANIDATNSEFRRDGVGTIYFTPQAALGTGSWRMSGSSAGFEPYGDNLQDIGISDSSRVRSFYGGTKIELLGTTFAPATTTTTDMVSLHGTFAPTANAPTFAMVHVNPTFNGTTTGTGYGIVVASKTNDLRGGLIRLLSIGTTTTDAFTGYSPFFAVTNHGALWLGTSPNDAAVRAHFAAIVHAETSFAVGAHVVTISNDGVNNQANAETLSGLRSLYLIDCNDPHGCTIELGTAGVEAGAITRLISISTNANALHVASTASVKHVASSFAMGTNDVLSFQFSRNRSGAGIWLETGRSNN